ncbi:hypothetical protein [Corynebacterium sp. LK2510]|uniref:hypothetical protein n=1 Tax=Corynebacterium sp. LK2510 TaxID=3110472 RepID=UPI0034CF798C
MTSSAMDRQRAEAARDAALSVSGVADLYAGRFGEIAILLPGTRVEGVRKIARDDRFGVEVHLVVDYALARDVRDIAAEVRRAVVGATGVEIVDVVVADAR